MKTTEAIVDASPSDSPTPVDLLIIGGGVNGVGVARDAVGRGLSVTLAEMNDLAQATSSASTKLFHGGLRYLEYYEFRLVRQALKERETLLRAMPHISWPLRFVLPHHKGLRPAWLLRLGLFLYDHLGGRKILPGTKSLNFKTHVTGLPLKDEFRNGFEYSDCWVEDSRLVVLNARDAEQRGATILPRTKAVRAERVDGLWRVTLEDGAGAQTIHHAKAVVNAGGPWVSRIVGEVAGVNSSEKIRLVRGSHIVCKKLFDHDRAYIFQGGDGRIVFAIPYETDYTLVGTTDRDHDADPSEAVCTPEERDYLCAAVSEYLAKPVTAEDVVWTYSGVRPLYDDGAKSATAATRDYVLSLDTVGGAPMLNIFGGKITTYRKLAEKALAKLKPHFPQMTGEWTAGVALPGGDFPVDGVDALAASLRAAHPFLSERWARRLVRAYGTEAVEVLAGAESAADLGQDFGATLTEREVDWLMRKEYARTAADVLWRRSKLGLRLSQAEAEALEAWMTSKS